MTDPTPPELTPEQMKTAHDAYLAELADGGGVEVTRWWENSRRPKPGRFDGTRTDEDDDK